MKALRNQYFFLLTSCDSFFTVVLNGQFQVIKANTSSQSPQTITQTAPVLNSIMDINTCREGDGGAPLSSLLHRLQYLQNQQCRLRTLGWLNKRHQFEVGAIVQIVCFHSCVDTGGPSSEKGALAQQIVGNPAFLILELVFILDVTGRNEVDS